MEDCTPVAQHHFRHPAAARYAGCKIFAHGRPPGPRMVSRSLALLTRVELDHILDGTVPFCYCRMHTKAAQHHLRHRLPCVHRGRLASQPTRAASRRGRARPRGAKPGLLELPQAIYWSVPCRFAAEECVRRLSSTISDIGAIPPYGSAAAAAVGLSGPYSGCCKGPGGLPHGKPGLGATQPVPAVRPWAAGTCRPFRCAR